MKFWMKLSKNSVWKMKSNKRVIPLKLNIYRVLNKEEIEMKDINKIVVDTKLSDEELKSLLEDMSKHGVITIPEQPTIETINSKLYDTVIKFMKDNDITCDETIYQCDSVIENAYEFIDKLFNIVKDDLDIEEGSDEY